MRRYICNKIVDYEVRYDLVYPDISVFAAVFVELLNSHSKTNLIVGMIYWPPGCDSDDFIKRLNQFYTHTHKIHRENFDG